MIFGEFFVTRLIKLNGNAHESRTFLCRFYFLAHLLAMLKPEAVPKSQREKKTKMVNSVIKLN